jgi:hypothetical protein
VLLPLDDFAMDFGPLSFCATTHINYDAAWTDQLHNCKEMTPEPHLGDIVFYDSSIIHRGKVGYIMNIHPNSAVAMAR